MSAPLELDSYDLRQIGKALDKLSKIAVEHNVRIGAYGDASITHTNQDESETAINVRWDGDLLKYSISDRVGS